MKIDLHPKGNNYLNDVLSNYDCGYLKISFNLRYLILTNHKTETDKILLNQIQRNFLQVTLDDEVDVECIDKIETNNLKKVTFVVDFFGKRDIKVIKGVKVPYIPIVPYQVILVKHDNVILKLTYQGNVEGIIDKDTKITFESNHENIIIPTEHKQVNILGMNLEEEGIGGLGDEFERVFKEAFVSRAYPPEIIKQMGIQHVKGMILYGPPGCGKSIFSRQLSKLLQKNSGKKPTIVNGPELLDSYIGSSEKNVRSLFAEAEKDQYKHGDNSPLHVIIFDEFDAIARKRGNGSDAGSRVSDGIVNQLLTKIDGIESLNNILVIGLTNRLDIIDPALLRAGRFGLHLHIGIPDLEGRKQILRIHTKSLKESNRLESDVDLDLIANKTDNYTGADLAAIVQRASSSALKRGVDLSGDEPKLDTNIKVTMNDFLSNLT